MLHGLCYVIDENIYTYKIWLFGMFFRNLYEVFNKLYFYGGIRIKVIIHFYIQLKPIILNFINKNKQ